MILAFSLLFFLIGTTAGDEGWIPVQREVKLDYNLDKTPLEIKTDSEVGSDESVQVYFYTAEGNNAGRVYLYFKSTMQYWISWCSKSYTNLPTPPPSSPDKVWKITLTRTSSVRLQVHCNGVEVLNAVISRTTCKDPNWGYWSSRVVEKIEFISSDTASDYYRPGWRAVERGIKFDYDLETTPIEIKSDSELGSDDEVRVGFYTAQEDIAGGIVLSYKSTVQYKIGHCSSSFSNLPSTLPSTTEKEWRITLTRTSGIRIQVHCNGVEVVNVLLSGTKCGNRGWNEKWSRNVEKIQFPSTDEASDYYRPNYTVKCTDLKKSWTNMEADKKFPVTAETEVTLSCKAGYYLKGHETVTCIKDTVFTSSGEPQCVACSAGTYKSSEMKTCQACAEGKEPSDNKTACACTGFKVTDGKVAPNGKVPENEAVTVSCFKPNILFGGKIVTCQPDWGWPSEKPTCRKCGKVLIQSFYLLPVNK